MDISISTPICYYICVQVTYSQVDEPRVRKSSQDNGHNYHKIMDISITRWKKKAKKKEASVRIKYSNVYKFVYYNCIRLDAAT